VTGSTTLKKTSNYCRCKQVENRSHDIISYEATALGSTVKSFRRLLRRLFLVGRVSSMGLINPDCTPAGEASIGICVSPPAILGLCVTAQQVNFPP